MSSKYHLIQRNGVYYYRRRVPLHLVQTFGKTFIQFSLKTASLKEAKKRRAAEDLKWSAQFEAAEAHKTSLAHSAVPIPTPLANAPLSEAEAIRLVQRYVEETDARRERRLLADPPANEQEREEMLLDAEIGAGIVRDRDDPRGDQLIYGAAKDVLARAGRSFDDPGLKYAAFAELVGRGLLELDGRHLARLQDQHGRGFLDQLFDPKTPPSATFGEVADEYLRYAEEEAEANGTNRKSRDRKRAHVTLIREIVGDDTPIAQVGFDQCRNVRSMLARVPSNREKVYPGLPIAKAVSRAEADARPTLSPVTQEGYLVAFRDILDLAAKKRLIPVNPAEGLTPLKRETIPEAAKRLPLTPEQLKGFFEGAYYTACATHSPPYTGAKHPWRFWLPLMCLFMGLRPNEVCQMAADDVKHTPKGTWFVDIVCSDDEEDGNANAGKKTLKTSTSRRKVPVHPELIKIGFLAFAQEQKKSGGGRLFAELKPDQYGNYASYALKRFRDSFLPAEITLKSRQTFYSFRHNFRDGLRQIDAPPDALQALGGWSQGKLTSDSYGDKFDPDYQARFMEKVAFSSLDVSHLHFTSS